MYMAVTLPLEPKCSVSKSVKGLRSLAMGVKVQNCTFWISSVSDALSTATTTYQRMMRERLLLTKFITWKRHGVCHFQGTVLSLFYRWLGEIVKFSVIIVRVQRVSWNWLPHAHGSNITAWAKVLGFRERQKTAVMCDGSESTKLHILNLNILFSWSASCCGQL